MLHDKIGSFHKIGAFQGKATVHRILPSDGQSPKFETTNEATGTILEIPARIISTYWSVLLPDSSFYGETSLQSLTITQDGDMGMFRGAGAGRFTGPGSSVSFRGAVYYHGASGKLAPLNGLALLYEWQEDPHGNMQINVWKWT
jgi:hypothetical protein